MPTPDHRAPSRRRLLQVGLGGALATLAAPWLSGCGIDDPGQELRGSTARTLPDPAAVRPAVEAVNRIGFDLFRALPSAGTASGGAGNLALAPVSVAATLAMAWRGAAGVSQQELATVLHDPAGATSPNAFVTLDQLLADRTGDRSNDRRTGRVALSFPRSLWAPRGTALGDAFLARLATEVDAGVRVIDFRSNPEAARVAINTWAHDQTVPAGQAVGDLLAPGDIGETTELVLASAAQLAAPWDTEFPVARTQRGTFEAPDGTSRDCTTMAIPSTGTVRCGHAAGGVEVVELPYLGQQLSLVLLVPPPGGFADLERSIDAPLVHSAIQSLEPGRYDVRLPRFGFRSTLHLEDAVRTLGAPSIFDAETADFGGITADDRLVVSRAVHQAAFAIDEEGSNGQAATVVRQGAPLPPPDTSATVDRAFVFLVRDRSTDLVLLLGRVVDPSAA